MAGFAAPIGKLVEASAANAGPNPGNPHLEVVQESWVATKPRGHGPILPPDFGDPTPERGVTDWFPNSEDCGWAVDAVVDDLRQQLRERPEAEEFARRMRDDGSRLQGF